MAPSRATRSNRVGRPAGSTAVRKPRCPMLTSQHRHRLSPRRRHVQRRQDGPVASGADHEIWRRVGPLPPRACPGSGGPDCDPGEVDDADVAGHRPVLERPRHGGDGSGAHDQADRRQDRARGPIDHIAHGHLEDLGPVRVRSQRPTTVRGAQNHGRGSRIAAAPGGRCSTVRRAGARAATRRGWTNARPPNPGPQAGERR